MKKAKSSARMPRPKIKKRDRLKRDGIPRAALWIAVYDRVMQFGLSRDDAAAIVRDAPSQLSRLMTGHVSEFSADRLALMLVRLACDIDIIVRPKSGPRATATRMAVVPGRVRVFRELRDGQRHSISV